MHAFRRVDRGAIRFTTILQAVIVLGGVVAVGLLVVAHPVIGAALIVGVVLLVLGLGRPPSRGNDDSDDEAR